MKKLTFGFTPIPDMYVAEDKAEAQLMMEHGIDRFIIRPNGWSDLAITMALFMPWLRKNFPDILWDDVFRKKTGVFFCDSVIEIEEKKKHCKLKINGVDGGDSKGSFISETDRDFDGGVEENYVERKYYEFLGDHNSSVDIDLILSLGLLPDFVADIGEQIYDQGIGVEYADGYNKKLGLNIGSYTAGKKARNLIILDISGSIPRGISSTMLALLDTMKEKSNADVIVTGSISKYWKYDEKLPSPKRLRNMIGYQNESKMFWKILKNDLDGKEFGNVFVFGDTDRPWPDGCPKADIKVHKLWSYHTCQRRTPGYGQWITKCYDKAFQANDFTEEIDISWCDFVRK